MALTISTPDNAKPQCTVVRLCLGFTSRKLSARGLTQRYGQSATLRKNQFGPTSVGGPPACSRARFTIFASGNKAEVKNVAKDDGKSGVDTVRGIISGQTTASAVTPAASASPVAPNAAPPPPPPSMPAGWYQDPDLLRYWDNGWTERTAPAPA
ncbi:DUF2510 domain-containing protein [Gordonia liuliyuniae]|uniref:DUF2510 domain-containing protein n=1 Tax=Gordonia liuliyuniae TaxID=2911517 RepID=UPI00355873D8